MSIRSATTHFDFVGKSKLFVTISSVLVLISVGLIVVKGLNYGIDFAGGTELQVRFQEHTSPTDIREALQTIGLQDARVQSFGSADDNEFLLRVNRSSIEPERYDAQIRAALEKNLGNDRKLAQARYVADRAYLTFNGEMDPVVIKKTLEGISGLTVHEVVLFGKASSNEYAVNFSGVSQLIIGALGKKIGVGKFEIRRDDTVGPKVGRELRIKSLTAIVVSLALLLIFIWLRFELAFAPGAILALFHDVTITLGVFALFKLQVDLTVLAALMTLLGYSLNDTIVIYDRIRENMRRMEGATLEVVINASVNQTLSRTIMTATATMLATVALLVLGGDTTFYFAFALSFGIVAGAYSTVYIASPVTILLNRLWVAKRA